MLTGGTEILRHFGFTATTGLALLVNLKVEIIRQTIVKEIFQFNHDVMLHFHFL